MNVDTIAGYNSAVDLLHLTRSKFVVVVVVVVVVLVVTLCAQSSGAVLTAIPVYLACGPSVRRGIGLRSHVVLIVLLFIRSLHSSCCRGTASLPV